MRTVGLVVEYNPLHNGHHYHLEAARQAAGADACVAVMSGNFLQRGEPALVSKWARAEMALRVGIDLVIELPVPYATANAEVFAHGAISLLDRIGVVDAICFGSESGDIEWMRILAKTLAVEPPEFSQALREELSQGLSYPHAYARAVSRYMSNLGYENVPIDQPNNILGLNYLLALERIGSPMKALTIRRQKAGYHQETITDQQIASATALRKLLFSEGAVLDEVSPFVPDTTFSILQREFATGAGPMNWERFRHPLFHRLLQLSPDQLAAYHEVEEGIQYRLKQAVQSSSTVQELVSKAKTRRFTWNRLQRILLSILLDLKKGQVEQLRLKEGAPYARILGFSEKGQMLLHEAKRKGRLPLISNARDGIHPMLDLDIVASSLYRLTLPSDEAGTSSYTDEYRASPLRITSAQAISSS
ncbi:nucleotidyltransferase [Brevibacillus humidisoli]|uniref:nucleotidyltransferase n=1 Tax=Brevibacillus humidisoli TaxID=2895522 RepID=UPI001E5C00A5|nr:nucleotidyltransferase [Brevibacillus humidisoli]UFJ42068.1 nucleotidyltransferase [Brevibacillus humidisoli]